MTSDALLLIGRATGRAEPVLQAHASRLVARGVVDESYVATYDVDPAAELPDQLAAVDADRVFAVPTSVAHTNDSVGELPGLLATIDADVRYCEPLGRSPAVTRLLRQRAEAVGAGESRTSVALVGLGSSAGPHSRQVLEYHAERLRATFDEVRCCFLVQNPTVECVRYNVTNDRVVAVPVFLSACEATEQRIPEKLELERGGVAYAEPLGTDPLVSDAIEARIVPERVVERDGPTPNSYEDSLVRTRPRLATDGQGE